jgi:hypothetical protein
MLKCRSRFQYKLKQVHLKVLINKEIFQKVTMHEVNLATTGHSVVTLIVIVLDKKCQ